MGALLCTIFLSSICPYRLPGISLSGQVLVALGPAESEHLCCLFSSMKMKTGVGGGSAATVLLLPSIWEILGFVYGVSGQLLMPLGQAESEYTLQYTYIEATYYTEYTHNTRTARVACIARLLSTG